MFYARTNYHHKIGAFDGYCVDTDTLIGRRENDLTAEVFSIYDDIPPEFLSAIDNPANLELASWILNQCFAGKDSSAVGDDIGTFTFSDVQAAIWTVLGESFNPNGNDLPDLGNDTTDPNASARVDKIVELAEANGGGFVPEYDYTTIFGEQVTGQLGVLLFPDRNTTDDNPFDKQPLIIGVELAKLGDRVWLDSDADGIQDAGENGIEGVTVNLLADTDNDGQIDDVVHTTTTDADGNYHFEVIAGDYVVEFEQPEGFEVSPANQGTDDTVDSDGLISDVVTLSSGESNPTIDQGFYQTASLGDFVFEDSNADGIQSAGETGIGGVEVTLLADTDNDGNIDDVVDTATTAADG
ncbi:SdrD B-like domain-containing protein, partial [Crocosphaera watsonii]|uniref:SdrD B-like domain-containing protein n=1 Tax=Crocosphaera watsonii TaxID=263511 RepID=UPI000651ED0B